MYTYIYMSSKPLFSILLAFLLLYFSRSSAVAAVPAFPGAQGWGAQALAGCDRSTFQIIPVTNLNDSGPESLRAALTASSPRIVVFTVGGIITLSSSIDIRGDANSCLYVAGQTAPGSGILITGNTQSAPFNMIQLQSAVHDVVFRYIRFRGNTNGNIDINGGHDIIFDHCSFSWTTNDSFDIWRADSTRGGPIQNITVQTSINSEIYDIHSTAFNIGGEHAFGYEKQVDHISIHHNLMGHDSHRNPNVSAVSVDIINNVLYNWKYKSTITKMGVRADIIGNYYKIGPMTRVNSSLTAPDRYRPIVNESTDGSLVPYPDHVSLYVVGNVRTPDFMDTAADNWPLLFDEGLNQPVDPSLKRSPWAPLPQAPIPITVESPTAAYATLITNKAVGADARLDCTGNFIPNRDRVDERILTDTKNGTQWFSFTDSAGKFRLPDSLAEAGGLPPATPGTACTDTDTDGMPDAWETARNLNPAINDSTADRNNDGYTNIEEFINAMGDPLITPSPTRSPSPSPSLPPVPTPTGAFPSSTPAVSCPRHAEGDADCDGQIKLTDMNIWRMEYHGEITTKRSDFTADGNVSLTDFELWRRHYPDPTP